MTSLNDETFRRAIQSVNTQGYGAIDLSKEIPGELGAALYTAMDANTFHPSRAKYYNEIAFYWPEDWRDVGRGIGAFHEEKSLKHVLAYSKAKDLMEKHLGDRYSKAVVEFASKIKRYTIENHVGLPNNELRLARVMLRQMNESHSTLHGGSDYHEDIGYSDRPYQQLLSVIITTFGIPTTSHRYAPKVGELLMFNAFDRRRLLGMSDDFAFVHKGPKTGPKMFFFFEFLGPREWATQSLD